MITLLRSHICSLRDDAPMIILIHFQHWYSRKMKHTLLACLRIQLAREKLSTEKVSFWRSGFGIHHVITYLQALMSSPISFGSSSLISGSDPKTTLYNKTRNKLISCSFTVFRWTYLAAKHELLPLSHHTCHPPKQRKRKHQTATRASRFPNVTVRSTSNDMKILTMTCLSIRISYFVYKSGDPNLKILRKTDRSLGPQLTGNNQHDI